MKQFVLALMLATIAACSGGRLAQDAKCPDDPNQQLSRAEWKACYGEQEEDTE